MTPTGDPPNLLLVDDSDDDALLIQTELAKVPGNGFAVTRVTTLAAAVARLRAENFEMVLLDLGLPDSDGLNSVREVTQAAPHACVIILTGADGKDLPAEVLAAGARDFFVKSSDPRPIAYSIDRWRYEVRTAAQARYQFAIAALGQLGLSDLSSAALFPEVLSLLTAALAVEFSCVLEFDGENELLKVCESPSFSTGQCRRFLDIAAVREAVTQATGSGEVVSFGPAGAPNAASTASSPTLSGLVAAVSGFSERRFSFVIGTRIRRSFRDTELQFVRTMAHLAGQILHRNATQEALRTSQAHMAAAQTVAHFGSWELELDQSGELITTSLRWSDEMYRIAGLDPKNDKISRELFYSMVPEDDRPLIRAAIEAAIRQRTKYSVVHRLTRPDGAERIIREIGRLHAPFSNAPLKLVGTAHDITDQRAAEEAVRLQVQMLDQIGEAVIVTDLEGTIIYTNRAAGELYGWPIAEMLQRKLVEVTSLETTPGHGHDVKTRIEQGESWRGEILTRSREGRRFPVLVTTSPLRGANGSLAGSIGIFRDISSLKAAEQRIREGDSMLRMALRMGRMGGWKVDLAEARLTWSEEVRALHEVEPDFIPTYENALAFYAPEFRSAVYEAFRRCVESATPLDLEAQIISGKGRRIWVRLIVEAVQDENGRITFLQGAIQDVSQAKESERQIRESAQRLANTLESMTDGFFTVDREWRFTYVNREAERLLRYHRAELLGRSLYDMFPETRGTVFQQNYVRALTENRTVSFTEYYAPHERWVEIRAYPTVEGLAIYFQDVSKDYLAAAALRASEERFRLLSKATNDVIWDWNLIDGTHWFSTGICTLFGYSVDELEPSIQAWATRVHPEDYERIMPSVRNAIESGAEVWQGEYRFKRKAGTYAYVLDRGYIIREEPGNAIRMIGSMTDVSDRREAEHRIAEQAALLDNAHDAIFVKDFDDRILYWNKGAERIFGYSAAEAVGHKSVELLRADPVKHEAAISELLNRGEWSGEVEKKCRAGRELTFDTRWTLVCDSAGRPKSILAINSDITEKKKLEAQFLRAQRMESIGTLAGGIAHDLNNVLAPIMMCLEMLEEQLPMEEDRALLTTIQKSAQRGAELVKQVLTFARGVEGKRVTLSPIHVLREVQRIVRDTFPKHIQFTLKVQDGLKSIVGDPTQLHQVFMNLVVNARDAMSSGGSLSITAENAAVDEVYSGFNPEASPGSYVAVTVADTGCGIAPEIREKIFDPFFTTKEVGQGTGLGLPTTLAIVKSHGGFINIYSEVGQGTRFKVYFPAAAIAANGEELALRNTSLPRGSGETILLVDDEESVRLVAKKTLERFGYDVILAANGAQAVSTYALHREKVGLVLTDMTMPIMDGASTAVALKCINPDVRIIGSSGLSVNDGLAQSFGASLDSFIPKPYNTETLLTAIHAVLNTRC